MRWPLATLALAATSALLLAIPGAATALEFRGGSDGAAWRWLTGHWVHFGAGHAAWDIATFAVLGAAVERRSRGALALVVVAASAVIALAVDRFAPTITHYRGLSGIDSALFAWLAVRAMRHPRRTVRTIAIAASAAFAAKVGYEIHTASTWFVPASTEWVPVPIAHAAGGAVGAALAAAAPTKPATARPTARGSRATCSSCGPVARPCSRRSAG